MNVQIFNNAQFGEIRTAGTADNPMFCLTDVCKALGLSSKGVNQRLEDEVISNYPIKDSLGREQQALFVNEDGLYDVILDSRKPKAKAFRKWVTSEVLPSIRKTGSYSTLNLSRKELAQMIIQAEEENERLQLENKRLQEDVQTQQNINSLLTAEVDTLAPKGRIYDQVISNADDNSLYTTRQVAQEIGMTDRQLFSVLLQLNVIYRQSDTYMIGADYVQWGMHQMVSHVINEETHRVRTYLKWTVRGRAYIHALHDTQWDKRRAWHLLKKGNELQTINA